jgi:hypothetical protein
MTEYFPHQPSDEEIQALKDLAAETLASSPTMEELMVEQAETEKWLDSQMNTPLRIDEEGEK